MNCKNCQDPLEENALFCDNCGAKVITNRITFKSLIKEVFVNAFGLDSKFFFTLKKMFTSPDDVLNEYLNGVRKRYLNPFGYLAIGAALSLIVFNFFSDDFIAIQTALNSEQLLEQKELSELDLSTLKDISKEGLQKLKNAKKSAKFQLEFHEKWLKFFLENFNLMVFIFIPFYALISKWIFRKPHNYGEHIVINAYLQGTTMYISILAFIISLVTSPYVYTASMFLYIIYYSFAFGRLYNFTFLKSLLKVFRFILGLLLISLIIFVIGILTAFFLMYLGIIPKP